MPNVDTLNPPASSPQATHYARRILLCLDRSALSEAGVPCAVSLAKTFGSAVTLLHVLEAHHEHPGRQPHDALAWELSRQEATCYLDSVGRKVSDAAGQAVDVRLEQGRPAERIVDVAREVGADLIVLASHGQGNARASTMGSTVHQVLELARSSIFIAPPSPSQARAWAPRRILVPLDGSRRSESVLPVAARIAAEENAEIVLVHVVEEPLPTEMLSLAEDMALARTLASRLESGARRYLDRVQRQLASRASAVRTIVIRHPREPQCLLEIAEREHVDLVVLSAHGAACDSASSFGSVASCLLASSNIPLLALQDLNDNDLYRAQDDAAVSAPPSPRARYAAETV
jgi:nucleotide-binding universal stress UspA family protein